MTATKNATPSDLDPSKATPPPVKDDVVKDESERISTQPLPEPVDERSVEQRLRENANGEISNYDGEGLIVHREVLPGGAIKEHGPMKLSEYSKYQRENGL